MPEIAMTNYARMLALSLLFVPCIAGYAQAAESPVGEWKVKDGTAHIRIVDCKPLLWGVIDWADTPGTDTDNPDPLKRNRSVLGLPILLGMRQGEQGRWNGKIYNADNGKTYTGDIRLKAADTLHVEGCVLGILCGGEDWERLATVPFKQTSEAICSHMGQ